MNREPTSPATTSKPLVSRQRSSSSKRQRAGIQRVPKYDLGLFAPPPNLDEICWLNAASLFADRTTTRARTIEFGGAGYNMSAILCEVSARNSVAALFPVPHDPRAAGLLEELAEKGIVTSTISHHDGTMRKNLVLEFEGGERRIVMDPTRAVAGQAEYPWKSIVDCGMVALNGSLPADVLKQCVDALNQFEIPWCWNPATIHLALLREGLADGATLLQLNAEEATEWLDAAHGVTTRQLLCLAREASRASNVVITAGREGAWGADRDGQVCHAAAPDSNIGKAVGMGDRFFALTCWNLMKTDEGLGAVLDLVREQLQAILSERR